MVSMKDIAKACGVSVATVSKALHDHKDIGLSTRKRVRETAKNMGYLPNLSARALKTNRTYNIGVLFVDEGRSGLTHEYFAKVLQSLKETAEEAGYDITFLNCSRSNRMTYLEHSLYRGFDGVIAACIDFYDPEVEELAKSDLPVVTLDHVYPDVPAVVSDNVKGMHDLIAYISKNGHKKVAFIYGSTKSMVTSARRNSFEENAQKFGLLVLPEYRLEAPYHDMEISRKWTKQLLTLPDRPTCILYPDDYSCYGGIAAIREMGLRVPADISVAGYDDIILSQRLEPKLTTLHQDAEKMGSCAAKYLIHMIEEPAAGIQNEILIPGWLVEGETVGKIATMSHQAE